MMVMDEKEECEVCYSEHPSVGCSNNSVRGCRTKTCVDCFERYLEVCHRENQVPRCMIPSCSGIYLRSACEKTAELYESTLLRGFLEDKGWNDEEKERRARQAMLDHVIQGRLRVLSARFPVSIQRAVQIMYPRELRRVENLRQKAMQKGATRKCFRQLCGGTMVTEVKSAPQGRDQAFWACVQCETRYCRACERPVGAKEDAHHRCDEGERASVEWRESLTKCPRCSQPVEKSSGCRFVTCAVCHQNFDYETGLPSAAGNHGQSTPVTLARDGIEEMMRILLRGRTVENLSPEEAGMYRELQGLSLFFMQNSRYRDWTPSQVLSSYRTQLLNPKYFSSVARSVASRVQRLEEEKQEYRTKCARLLELERFVATTL